MINDRTGFAGVPTDEEADDPLFSSPDVSDDARNWLAEAKPLNPNVSDDQLLSYYHQTYDRPSQQAEPQASPNDLPSMDEWLAEAKPLNPNTSDAKLRTYWRQTYGKQGAPEKAAEKPGDVARGFSHAFQQLPQTAYGLEAGAGAIGEKVLGEGGVSTAIKEHGLKKYQEASAEIAKSSKASDSATTAYAMAKDGNPGALVDWLQYALGYSGGQTLQMLATAGLGYAGGKLALKPVASAVADKLVAKEAARIAATEAGASLTADQLTKQAVSAVAGRIGQTVALATTATGMEGGEIYGDLVSKAAQEGRPLTGDELAKAAGATLGAGALEFAGDKIGLDLILGKSVAGKLVSSRLGHAAAAGALGIATEGGTEFTQTLLEEYGKGNDPFSPESIRQAIDSAALGAVGGGAVGGIGGLATAPAAATRTEDIPAKLGVANPDVSLDDTIRASQAILDEHQHLKEADELAIADQQAQRVAQEEADLQRREAVLNRLSRAQTFAQTQTASDLADQDAAAMQESAARDTAQRAQLENAAIPAPERTRPTPQDTPILSGPQPTPAAAPIIQPGQAFTPRPAPELSAKERIAQERARILALRDRRLLPSAPPQEPPSAPIQPAKPVPSAIETGLAKVYPSADEVRATATEKGFNPESPLFREIVKAIAKKSVLEELTPQELQLVADKLNRLKPTEPAKAQAARPEAPTPEAPQQIYTEPIHASEARPALETVDQMYRTILDDTKAVHHMQRDRKADWHVVKRVDQAMKSGLKEGLEYEQAVQRIDPKDLAALSQILGKKPAKAIQTAPPSTPNVELTPPQQESRRDPPIVRYKKEASRIQGNLPNVRDGFTRLWRGNRPHEIGKATQFTNDLAGIALPFRDAYRGELSYVDVPTDDLQLYVQRVGATENAEFNLPSEIASRAGKAEQLSIDVPPPTVGERSVIGREAQPEDAEQGRFSDRGSAHNDAAQELRGLSHEKKANGDVLLDNFRYVALADAVRIAREGIESGAVKPFPFQLNNLLGISMADANRVLKAAQTPDAEQTELPEDRPQFSRAAKSSAPLADTLDVAGVQRPTRNSDGKPIAQTEEAVRNFWRWFGASKTVDAQGRPRVVYHGTGSKFSTFNKKKSTQGLIWFTSNKASIEAGEVGAQGKGVIMELYAKVEHPADWTQYDKLGLYEFKREGLDGAILTEQDGQFDGFVFESSQLKSATGNKGTFDPAKSNILFSRSRRLPKQGVQAVVDRLRLHGTATNIRVLPYDELPQAIRDEAEALGDPADVNAVMWHGDVYLVDGRFTSEAEVEQAVFHELYHKWINGYLGNRAQTELNDIFRRLGGQEALLKLADKYKWADARQIMKDYAGRSDLTAREKTAAIVNELLAEAGSRNHPMLTWKVKEFVGAIRRWLREHGFATFDRFTESDLADLLKRARQADGAYQGGVYFARNAEQRFSPDEEANGLSPWIGEMPVASDWKQLVEEGGRLSRVRYVDPQNIETTEAPSRSAVDYAKSVLSGNQEDLPALVVEPNGDGTYFVVDGNSRLTAAKELNFSMVPVRVYDTLGDMATERGPGSSENAQTPPEPGRVGRIPIFRGEYTGNKGGQFYSEDQEFARQFTQSGQDHEIKRSYIDPQDIYTPTELPYAGDPDVVDAAVKEARSQGYKAVRLSEGTGQPPSIYVFNKTALKSNSGPQQGGPLFSRTNQTQTDAFKAWFGNSKVVDADGRPLVVYHGSASDFSEFKPSRDGGIYFAGSSEDAGHYAEINSRIGGPPRIIPAYLKMERDAWNWIQTHDMPGASTKEMHDAIKEAGFDGYHEPGGMYVVFDPKQIKSATGNRGTFDPDNPSILFSRSKKDEAAYTLPELSGLDTVIRTLQDKNIDMVRLVDAIKSAKGQIADDLNPVQKEELYLGKVVYQNQAFLNDELRPLVDAMRLAKVSMAELEQYLHARHAKEANAYLQSINKDREDNTALSGMTDQEAEKILLTASPKMEALAKRVDRMIQKSRTLMVDYGLESQETVDAWAKQYQHYVPLYREGKEQRMGTGQGRSVRGSSSKERVGSTRKVEDILAHIAMDREKVIVRGEKMRPVLALAGLLKLHPNEEIAQLAKPTTITYTDPETGLTTTMPGQVGEYHVPTISYKDPRTGQVVQRPDPAYKGRDNVVNFRVNGEDLAIIFNEDNERAMQIAHALKDLDLGNLNDLMAKVASVTRYFAAINTQYNPIFGLVNFVRDAQFAMLSLSSTPLKGKQLQIVNNARKLILGIYNDARAVRKGEHVNSAASKMWERFQAAGGPTGYRDLFRTSADRAKAIQKLLDPDWWQKTTAGKVLTAGGILKNPTSLLFSKVGKGVLEWLSDYNLTMENAMRLAVFQSGVEAGMSDEKAASVAKNITVNFNKKGQISAQAGALYAFFNASVQGTARLAETLFEPGKVGVLSVTGKKIVAGGVTLGVVQAVTLALMGFDDDEPPEFIKAKYLLIPAPGTDKGYISIPMPLGFHVLPAFGRLATEAMIYGNPGKKSYEFLSAMLDSFSPTGMSSSLVQTLAPTVADPLVALGENKDWTGKPIYREDFNKLHPTPGHTRAKDSASVWSRFLSEAINYATGGSDYTPGIFSPSPDSIDYLIGQMTGGVGREFFTKPAQVLDSALTGEELPMYKVPLLGRFVGSASGSSAIRDKFYANVRRLNEEAAELKGRREHGEDAAGYLQDHPEARYAKAAQQIERDISQLTKRKRELIRRGANREMVKLVDQQIRTKMERLNQRVAR